MTVPNLHERLDALEEKIEAARGQIEKNQKLFKEHQRLTGRQLEDRYQIIKQKLERDVADAEAHGHLVGNLEKSVYAWIESINAEI